jgi:hypothetical protein
MKVFVSYSSHDGAAVRSLAGDLERARLQVWYDLDLGGGESWWGKILEQIRDCTVFVFALSDKSLRSKPCRAELLYAKALDLPILPVQIGAVSTYRTDPIFATQLIDYRDSTKDSGIALVSALHDSATRRAELPDPLPEPPAIPYEYLLRLGADIRGSADLSPTEQAAIVFELRTALGDEDDTDVCEDIRDLLRSLRARRDVAYSIVQEIDTILAQADDGRASATAETPDTTVATPTDTTTERSHHTATPVARDMSGPTSWNWTRGRIVTLAAAIAVVAIAVPLVVLLSGRSSSPVHGPARPAPLGAAGPAPPQQIELLATHDELNRVAVDAAGNAYVTDDTTKQVLKLAAGPTTPITPTTVPFGNIDFPASVAVDGGGTIYVSDRGGGARVLKLAPGASAPDAIPVKAPAGLAVDNAGTIYVSSVFAPNPGPPPQVLKLPPGGAAQVVLPFAGIDKPLGVAIDAAGAVYVSDLGTNRVLKLPPGAPASTELPFSGLDRPWGVAVDPAGAVYVSDMGGRRVVKLAAGSTIPTEVPFRGLNGPKGVAVGPDGSVFVVDTGGRVLKLPPR